VTRDLATTFGTLSTVLVILASSNRTFSTFSIHQDFAIRDDRS